LKNKDKTNKIPLLLLNYSSRLLSKSLITLFFFMKYYFGLVLLLFVSSFVFAQNEQQRTGNVSGFVIDDISEDYIEYANIVLYSVKDSSLTTGGITNARGYFNIENIPYGKYYIDIDFIGYNKNRIESIQINNQHQSINLGKIKIQPALELLGEVEIEAERSRVEYKLDRKVINVDKDLNAVGGSAVDVLENVPSVQTDVDGEVSIRGSSNFVVLIDGRPSPLDGSDALQQIPASSIENIEIITNPSAKYDPDGVGGIINIILKKQKRVGINGQFSASYGSFNSYSGDALVNIRREKFNFFVGGNIRKSIGEGQSLFEQMTYGSDTLVLKQDNDRQRERSGGEIKAGFDYYLTDNDIFSISAQYGENGFGRSGVEDATKYWLRDGVETDYYYYLSDNLFDISGNYWTGDLNYTHKFMRQGHEIQAYAYYSNRSRQETNKYEEIGYLTQEHNDIISYDSTMTVETSDVTQFRGKIDYTLPLFAEGKLEAGYQVRNMISTNKHNYITLSDQEITDYTFDRNIQSGYVTFSNITGKFGYMIGLRSEYTYRTIELTQLSDLDTSFNFIDFFPTLHTSYKLPWDMEIMASYSRRINRPRGYHLNPMVEVSDPYNIRQGNPLLKPEDSHAAEINFQKAFSNNFVSIEAYYRHTNNKIERVRSISPDNSEIMITKHENIGEDRSIGAEMMTNISFTKWWNFNISGNYYYYEILSNSENNIVGNNTFSWGGRMNQTFRIKKTNSMIQLSGFYFGPSITSQGNREGSGMINIALRQDFLDNSLSITLNLRDILNTLNHEFIYDTPEFYSYFLFDRKSPTFDITVTYRLNDFKNKRERGNGQDFEVDDNGEM
jgi:outer membrane cobalamin receptor